MFRPTFSAALALLVVSGPAWAGDGPPQFLPNPQKVARKVFRAGQAGKLYVHQRDVIGPRGHNLGAPLTTAWKHNGKIIVQQSATGYMAQRQYDATTMQWQRTIFHRTRHHGSRMAVIYEKGSRPGSKKVSKLRLPTDLPYTHPSFPQVRDAYYAAWQHIPSGHVATGLRSLK